MKAISVKYLIVTLLMPLTAMCQLNFNPPLDDGIDFGEVLVDEEEDRIITASLVGGEGWARWWFRGNDDCFSFNPDRVFFEERGVVQQDITLTFSPEEAEDYEVTLMIEFEDEDEGNLYSYQVILTGTGVDQNRDPVITEPDEEILEVQIDEAEELNLGFTAEDPDDDDLTWSVADEGGLPDGWEFTDNGDGTAQFVWRPPFDHEDEYDPLFRVEDDRDGSDEIQVIITFDDAPPPRWEEVPERVEVWENELLVFMVIGVGPDEEELCIMYMSDDLPDDVQFEELGNGRGVFRWQTTFDDAGDYTATFLLTDDGEFYVEADVQIIVNNVNRAPVWDNIPEFAQIDEDEELTFNVEASDPDDDGLTLEASSVDLPGGWDFTNNGDGTGVFTWTPGFDDSGDYTLTVTVSDAEFDVDEDVSITVNHVNRTPVWDNIPESAQIDEDEEFTFNVEASDPDDDNLSIEFTSDDLPDNVEFTDNGDGMGVFSWHPSFDDAGEYTATFILTDGDYQVVADVPITVLNIDYTPWLKDVSLPTELSLSSVYPNPFNSTAAIKYSLPSRTDVSLGVYNLSGHRITTLFEGYKQPSCHTAILTAGDLPSGLYFVRLKASDQVFTQKVMLIR